MTRDEFDEIRAARRELDVTIDEIRAVPGFSAFLAPPGMDELAAAARHEPLVYLAAAEPGGLALVVRGDDVVHVPLPKLAAAFLRERAGRYLEAHTADKATQDWRGALDEVTGWLWTAVMAPVLAELRTDGAATLVAGGLLGLLPLHAAWTPDTARPAGRRYALDELTLRYVPNARALSAARELAAGPVDRLVTVADPPRTERRRPLEYAQTEVMVAAAAFADRTDPVAGPGADARTVAEALTRADVAHLACHGRVDLTAPLNSRLLLAGSDELRLRDLLALRLRLRLAVLSACETSVPGSDLPDEVVSLPTGLLQAGAAGVLAALWEVLDEATAMLMTEFYRLWRHGERPIPPPVALRKAQIWLRDTTDDEKRRRYEQAHVDGAAWLPPDVAQEFLLALDLRATPHQRHYAHPDFWAGFGYYGV